MRNITAPVQWAYLPFVPRPDFNIQNPFFLLFLFIWIGTRPKERKRDQLFNVSVILLISPSQSCWKELVVGKRPALILDRTVLFPPCLMEPPLANTTSCPWFVISELSTGAEPTDRYLLVASVHIYIYISTRPAWSSRSTGRLIDLHAQKNPQE